MANRIMLNQTSYHGAGAIAEIATEAKAHGFKKALVCSDPDLIKFNVTSKVTDILDKEGLAYEIYSDIKANPTIENVQHGVQAFKNSGADYIKTGTGFLGATTLEIVKKVMDQARNKILVKAAGGIMGYETINAMKNMGVDRFGMGYEKAIRLMEEMKNKGKERYHGEIYS